MQAIYLLNSEHISVHRHLSYFCFARSVVTLVLPDILILSIHPQSWAATLPNNTLSSCCLEKTTEEGGSQTRGNLWRWRSHARSVRCCTLATWGKTKSKSEPRKGDGHWRGTILTERIAVHKWLAYWNFLQEHVNDYMYVHIDHPVTACTINGNTMYMNYSKKTPTHSKKDDSNYFPNTEYP